jgi:glycosyltransferase involved in cell wall biosynthesis
MAMAKTIISTSIGAEGINCSNEKNIYIANNKDEFIQAIDKSLESETKCRDIGNNARKLIEEEHNQAKLCQGLAKFYENLLDTKGHKQS